MKSESVEKLLRQEIAEVVGCTEPAAVAYAVQCAKRYLKRPFDPDKVRIILRLSPEVLRNASTAVVPVLNRRGIKAAVTAGLLSSSTDFNLFASLKVPRAHPLPTRRAWLAVVPSRRHGIYIRAVLIAPGETVTVTVNGRHDSIAAITRNGEIVYRKSRRRIPRLKGLKEIAAIVKKRDPRLESIARKFIMNQVKGDPGKTLSDRVAELITQRMNGRLLPAVTITGSGNQGIFLGVPLRALYRKLGRRALPAILFSLLTQIYVSQLRKRISDTCGLATKSAPALAAGLAYAQGEDIPAITRSMMTVYERLKKMPCHGAKPSCGVKASHALRGVLPVG
jgi:L-cysteine desulfidase